MPSLILPAFLILLEIIAFSQVTSMVRSPPSIKKEPPNDELLFQVPRKGETDQPFILQCDADGDPAPAYRWTKNGKEFNWLEQNGRISQRSGSGTLIITAPKNEDAGRYQCFASNKLGTATSNSVNVRKAQMDSFNTDEGPLTTTAEEGAPFKMTCDPPYAYPKPRIYWILSTPQGALLSINSSRMTVDPEGTLWFSNVTRNDRTSEYWYTCSAYSLFGGEYRLGSMVSLHVLHTNSSSTAPSLQYVTERNTSALKGSSKSLWCIVGEHPCQRYSGRRRAPFFPLMSNLLTTGRR
ncbi:neuroglian-like [Folsomia candida]|uniref:neuroglian-like n=1 Tax=Folsomia candida TaxID=158441 RepID=UPI001604AEE7|nr:neuroglian-like [Folsomia candida]XP_035700748.1 neuroglian-like [Folsomia candida]XP_035700749.1 neuroglian-like [Folsomia candida]